MNNSILYGFFIKYTISNQVIHYILIIGEYFFFIFPYVINSGNKLSYFNKKYEQTKLEDSVLLFGRIKTIFTKETIKPSDCLSPYILSLLIILVIFLIMYYFLLAFYSKKVFFDMLLRVMVNIYNLIIYRYFSFFFIDAMTFSALALSTATHEYYTTAISYVLFGLQAIYFSTILLFISNYSVYIKIANKQIVKSQMNYPFDTFSSEYEKLMLLFKIIISYEANYSYLVKDYVYNINYLLNIVIIIMSIFMLVEIVYKNVFLNINLVIIYTNFNLNSLRKFIISFNCFVALLTVVYKARTMTAQLIIIILSLFLGACAEYIIWVYTERPKIYDFRDEVNEEIVVYLFSKSFTLGTKAIKNNNLAFYEKIMSIVQTNHIIHCADPSTCIMCKKIKDLDVSVYEKLYFLYKYNLKNKRVDGKKSISYHHYLIKLFYSKIRGKTYKFYKNFFYLLNNKNLKLPVSIQNTLSFLVNDTMEIENETGNIYLRILIDLSTFNKDLTVLLKRCKNFIEQNPNLKTADELLEISRQLSHQQSFLFDMLNAIEKRAQNSKQSIKAKENLKSITDITNQKNIQSVAKYNLTLSRYIIETVLNNKYKKIPPLNIESLEEYLSFHFIHDKILILSTKIEDHKLFEVVKSTGFLGRDKVKFLSDFFPKKFQKAGNEKMFKTVNFNINNLNGVFEYIINKKDCVEHFKLNFELAKTIIDNKIMIYGNYSSFYDKIIILRINTNNNSIGVDADKVEVVTYSKAICKLFLIKTIYIEIFNHLKNHFLNLSNIFHSIKFQNKDDSVMYLLHCKFSYNHLYKTFCGLSEQIFQNFGSLTYEGVNLQEDMEKIKTSFQKKMNKSLNIVMTKLFPVSKTCYAFSLEIDHHTPRKDSVKKELSIIDEKTLGSSSAGENVKAQDSIPAKNFMMSQYSGSSGTNNNSYASSSSMSNKNSTLNQETNKATVLIKKETKKISLVSLTIFGLNFFLILLCLIFLFVQISQTNQLKLVNTFYFDFKSLRLKFNNIFYTVTSCVDLCPSPDETNCENVFMKFLDNYQKVIDFTEFPIKEVIYYEMTSKVNTLKNFYSNFKISLQGKSFKKFSTLLDREIQYYSIQQLSNDISPVVQTITFEQELQMYINSLYILIERKSSGDVFNEPFYIYTYEDSRFDFKNYKSGYFTEIQHEIFKLFTNYGYYAASFDEGEKVIENEFTSLRKTNLVFSILIMCLLLLLNTVILGINIKNLNIASYLFKKLICSLIFRVEQEALRNYLMKKFESLIQLSLMYKKNPSTLIQNIALEQSKYNKDVLRSQALLANSTSSHDIPHETEDEKKFYASLTDTSYHMLFFTNQILFPLYLKNIGFFVIYYIIAGIFDIVLIVTITTVYAYQDYVTYNYEFQKYLYSTISIVHLFRLINTTETSYAVGQNIEIADDGIVNPYLRNTFNFYNKFTFYQQQKNYIKITDYYANSCDTVYATAKDDVFEAFIEEYGKGGDYKLQSLICKNLHFDQFDSMYFIFEDLITLLQNLHNKYTLRTYESLYEFENDIYLSQSYLYMYFFVRPIKENFDLNFLTPLILNKFSSYVMFVWIYMIMNIVMEIILFVFNKVFIVQELVEIQEYFFLFIQCTE